MKSLFTLVILIFLTATVVDAADVKDIEKELKVGVTKYLSICSVEPPSVFITQFVSIKNRYRIIDLKGQCSLGSPVAKTRAEILVEVETKPNDIGTFVSSLFNKQKKEVVLTKEIKCPFNPNDADNNIVTFFINDNSGELTALCGKQETNNNNRINELIKGSAQWSGNSLQRKQDGQNNWQNQTTDKSVKRMRHSRIYPNPVEFNNINQDYWSNRDIINPINNQDDWMNSGEDSIVEFHGEYTAPAPSDIFHDRFALESIEINEYNKASTDRQPFLFFEDEYLSKGNNQIGDWLDNNHLGNVGPGDIDWNDYTYKRLKFEEKYKGWEDEFARTSSLREMRLIFPKINEEEYRIMTAIYAQNQSSWSINLYEELPSSEVSRNRGWMYRIFIGWYLDPIMEFFNRN